jgi:hypothetical protein
MAIFLKWQNTDVGSKDRIIADLFSYLSVRWYPVNVIGSNTFDIFNMYSLELASASAEVRQAYDDLFISSVRTTPIGSNSTSKMYDNFGVIFGVDKLFNQDYELYSNSYSLQSYRQELRLLGEAFFSGISIEGLSRVGQAYTGIAPVVLEPLKYYPGWALTTYTGSVASVGSDVLILSGSVPRIGSVIPYTVYDPVFVAGEGYAVSNSVLGYNTTIRDEQFYYSGLSVYTFGASASVYDSSFQSSIEQSMLRVIKGDQKPKFYYSTNFASYRPSTGYPSTSSVVDSVFSISSDGYLYNANPTAIGGSSFTGNSILCSPATGSCNYYYDWLVLNKNDSRYTMSIRTYPSASIPSTVYYRDYDLEPIRLLSHPSASVSSLALAHWVFGDLNAIWDISKSAYNLYPASGSGNPVPLFGRSEDRSGYQSNGNGFAYAKTSTSIQGTDTSFAIEMWVKGVDTHGSGSSWNIGMKHTASTDYTGNLTSNGYLFKVDGATNQLVFNLQNTTQQSFSASIGSYFNEQPSRYHYFATTYVSGSVYLYADDQVLLTNASSSVGLPGVGTAYLSIFASGSGFGIDEMVYSPVFLTPEMAKTRFEATKPRLLRIGVERVEVSQYCQPKFTAYASGSNEIEFHQFNVKWLPEGLTALFDKKKSDVFDVPLFLVTGSVI